MTATAPVSIALGADAGTVVVLFSGQPLVLNSSQALNLAEAIRAFAGMAEQDVCSKDSVGDS